MNEKGEFCQCCGKTNEKKSKFCKNCGNSLVNTQQNVNLQPQQSYTSTITPEDMKQSELKENPRKFSFMIVMGIIGCFSIPIPIINIIVGVSVLILYAKKGNEKTFLGKFLKVMGIIYLSLIILGLLLLGACIFTFTGFL